MDYQERRQFPRFLSPGETIALLLIPAWWPSPGLASAAPEEITAEIIDRSGGGLGVRTAHPLEMAQKVLLSSGGQEQTGTVVWVSRLGQEFRAGIQFL